MQELREHYERQATEDLLEIAKNDLTDVAREVLIQVLAIRGVSASEVETAREQGIAQEARRIEVESRLAPRWKRLIAFTVDLFGVFMLLFVLLSPIRLTSDELHANVSTIVWLAYFLLRDSIPGQSIGKRLLGLRAVRVESGLSCSWPKSIGRNLLHFLFILDALFALGTRRMRLGDMLAGTIVVRASVVPLNQVPDPQRTAANALNTQLEPQSLQCSIATNTLDEFDLANDNKKKKNYRKRPTSVSAIAWILIVHSIVSMVASPVALTNPMVKELMAKSPLPMPLQYMMLYVGLLVTVTAAIAMLNGQNWARFLYVVWSAIGLVIGVLTSPMQMAMIPGLVVFVVITFFLFRPKSNDYFSQREAASNV